MIVRVICTVDCARGLGAQFGAAPRRPYHATIDAPYRLTYDPFYFMTINTLLYVAGLLGWLGFWPFDALYTQRIRIGWGQMMVLFIWPQSHLYGKINTKARSSLCCPWWGQHLGHYSGPICSLSRKLANCASKFGWILSLWVMLIINNCYESKFLIYLFKIN